MIPKSPVPVLVLVGYMAWSVRILRNIISYIHLWYVKEHRPDRMIVHLRTRQGKRILFPQFKIPPLTPKTVLLSILTVGTLAIGWVVLPLPMPVRFLVVDLGTFPLMFGWELILALPTGLFHARRIRQAEVTMSDTHFRSVIGITGSYGKTSVKNFTAHILETGGIATQRTRGSINSAIGIAELILKDGVNPKAVFVAEMGAYKPGEIKRMCQLVQPDIAVLTAVNAQHQDLFGSIDRTVRAKYELVEGLSGNGTVICNADNRYTREMGFRAQAAGKSVRWYSLDPEKCSGKEYRDLLIAETIQPSNSGTTFTVTYDRIPIRTTTSLLGVHQIGNMLAAVAAAMAAGVSYRRAVSAIRTIPQIPQVLESKPGTGGLDFIDDTFNNNPDAALAAIAVLGRTAGKKFLVFQPMIELGEYADDSHRRVGQAAGSVCDVVILTNDNFHEPFLKGVAGSKRSCTVKILPTSQAAAFIRQTARPGDTVLFKGKEAGFVLKALEIAPQLIKGAV